MLESNQCIYPALPIPWSLFYSCLLLEGSTIKFHVNFEKVSLAAFTPCWISCALPFKSCVNQRRLLWSKGQKVKKKWQKSIETYHQGFQHVQCSMLNIHQDGYGPHVWKQNHIMKFQNTSLILHCLLNPMSIEVGHYTLKAKKVENNFKCHTSH